MIISGLQSARPQPVLVEDIHVGALTMKIIIVGAGISGLSTYLHLRKHLSQDHEITIYESYAPRSTLNKDTSNNSTPLTLDELSKSTVLVGGGLGISPNGMRVLRTLDSALHSDVVAQGFPVEHFVFKGANGWTLGKQRTSDKSVRLDGDEEVCVSSSRHGLWETLLKHVGEGVVMYQKVIGIERDEATGRTLIKIVGEQGKESIEIADLLIGADGSKSMVRTALFGHDEAYQAQYR